MANILNKAVMWTSIGLAAAVAVLGTSDYAHNAIEQRRLHQHKSQVGNESYLSKVSERAAKERKLTITAYDISAVNDFSYDKASLESYLNEAFSTLGIKVDVIYNQVIPAKNFENRELEWEKETKASYSESMSPEELENLLVTYGAKTAQDWISEVKTFFSAGIGSVHVTELSVLQPGQLERCLLDSLGNEAFYTSALPSSDVVALVLADFKDDKDVVAAATWSNTFFKNYIVIDKKKNGNQISQKELNGETAHEAGHQIGLHHPSTWFFDVMGYTAFSEHIINFFPGLAFGPESRLEWREIKDNYALETQASSDGKSPASPQTPSR